MENPIHWSDEVRALDKAISEALKELDSGIIGVSLPQNVYNKLLATGFEIVKRDGR